MSRQVVQEYTFSSGREYRFCRWPSGQSPGRFVSPVRRQSRRFPLVSTRFMVAASVDPAVMHEVSARIRTRELHTHARGCVFMQV